jgi:hypothetical protein
LPTDKADCSTTRQPTCRIAHDWRCHVVAEGRFYKCPQSYFLGKTLSEKADPARGSGDADGIEISDAPTFRDQLCTYLESPDPLNACRPAALGTVGRRFGHEQVPRHDWVVLQAFHTADEKRRKGAGPGEARRRTSVRVDIKGGT